MQLFLRKIKMRIPLDKAREVLIDRINEAKKIPKNSDGKINFGGGHKWVLSTELILNRIFGNDDIHIARFQNGIEIPNPGRYSPENQMVYAVSAGCTVLFSFIEELDFQMANPELQQDKSENPNESAYYFELLNRIFKKFHLVAIQLQKRRKGKQLFLIENETDVQDLLRALLTPFFENIRPEEPTPSVAGQYARIDFILKDQKIAIEVKIAFEGHLDSKIFDELHSDFLRYEENRDCNVLICFIYDPDFKLKNASALDRDIQSWSTDKIEVMNVIVPER